MLSPSYSINLFKEHIYIQQHLHFEFSVFLNQSSLPEIFISGKGKKKKRKEKKSCCLFKHVLRPENIN